MKIRTTGPSFYIVRPNGIKIKPGESSLFEITLREKSKAFVLLDLTVAATNVAISKSFPYNCSKNNQESFIKTERVQ